MAFEVMVPRLGWSMESGVFGEWLKQDGDAVAVGDPVFTIEGEKATEEVESEDAGVLHIRPGVAEPGVELTVGTVIGWLLAEGEPVPEAPPDPAAKAVAERAPKPEEAASGPTPAAAVVPRSRLPAASGRTAGSPPAPGPDESRESSASTGGWPPDPARGAVSASATSARWRQAVARTALRRQPRHRCPTSARGDRSRWCR